MTTHFTTDRRWQGRTVACIASGPSLTAADCDAVRAAGLTTIAVNNAGLPPMAGFADVHYACDGRWFTTYPEALAYERLKIHAVDDTPTGCHKINLLSGAGFDDRPDTVRAGQNSGYQAIHLAAHFLGAGRGGGGRIVLLGYDMQRTRGRAHFHGDHRRKLANPEGGALKRWAGEHFPILARALEARGVEVVNCSRATALTCFRRAALEDVLCIAPS